MTSCRYAVLVVVALAAPLAAAQNVKVTPLGSHAGELCDRDRATLFEDPSGVRILYDAGQSVTGADDPRLGDVHVVLLTHAHGDHMGDRKLKAQDAGTCAAPETVSAAPNSTTAEIAAAKNSALVMMIPMAAFIGRKVDLIKGKPTANCPADLVVPLSAPCIAGAHLGGTRSVRTSAAVRPVEITLVYAAHDSTVSRDLLTDPEKKNLEPDNLGLSLGPPTGYVVQFTNGLKMYLTGDTGIHAEMRTVVGDYYKANLVMFNLGPNAVSPATAAYAVNELIKPAAVIASHVNEGATSGGKVRPDSRTAAFMNQVKGRPVYLALSGRTMEFDGNAKCVSGC